MSAALDFRKCKRLLLSSLAVSPGTGVCVAKQRHDEIVRNPHIDDIEKQVEQEVQLVFFVVEMRGFEPRFVLLHPTPSTCLFGD